MSNHSHSDGYTSHNDIKNESKIAAHEDIDDIFGGLVDLDERTSQSKASISHSLKHRLDQILHDLDHSSADHGSGTYADNKNTGGQLQIPHKITLSALLISVIIVFSFFLANDKESGKGNHTSKNIKSEIASSKSDVAHKDSSNIVRSDSKKKLRNINSPPRINSADIVAVILESGNAMEVKASAADLEEDNIYFDYEWSVNGKYAGEEPKMTQPLKRGDSISVKISPYDDLDYGFPLVLTKEIHNTPPRITGGISSLDGSLYTYQLEASDNDNDTLTYALTSAPEGMSIDSAGQITWTVPPKYKGAAEITIDIDDGHGGKARQQLTLSIKDAESPSETP
ncbi:MAG: hypothetical protein JSW20_06915 [Nitrospiraceae bacterium]|nr:MAG: hypothetical protein JSW20_06915 [Nitrospiraceae bacterium]